jgi:hypothetical protein
MLLQGAMRWANYFINIIYIIITNCYIIYRIKVSQTKMKKTANDRLSLSPDKKKMPEQ